MERPLSQNVRPDPTGSNPSQVQASAGPGNAASERIVFVHALAASLPFTSKWEPKKEACCSCSWKW